MGRIWIGTSGWHYKHWVGRFYPDRCPASRMLSHYIEQFDTVELNTTFYHLPKPDSVACWRHTTPDDFCFAVKGSRFLTHMKKLKDPAVGLDRFFHALDALEQKTGPILWQLPPNWDIDVARLRTFLECLPAHHQHAFEFRNPTWNVPQVYRLLRDHNAGWCAFHLAGVSSPVEITADFTYVRLHGPGGKYQGSYSDETLQQWAVRIREWNAQLRAVYLYFDNDDSGYAAVDALRLKQILGL